MSTSAQISYSNNQYIWLNGKFVHQEDANIPILTHGFHYAGLAFEGIKCYDGKPFKLIEHIARLIQSAELIGIKSPYSSDEIQNNINILLQKNNIVNGYIRPLIWRGAETMKIDGLSCSINVAITAWTSSMQEENRAFSLCEAPFRKIGMPFLPSQTKCSTTYTMATLCKQYAIENGFDDVVMLDINGHIAEASVANIFFIKDQTLYTPTSEFALNGITKQVIIKIAINQGFLVEERNIDIEEIDNFDECFLTGTALEIKNVNDIKMKNMRKKYPKNFKSNTFKVLYQNYIKQYNAQ